MRINKAGFVYINICLIILLATIGISAQSGRTTTAPEGSINKPQKKNKRPDPSQSNPQEQLPPADSMDKNDIVKVSTSLVNVETTVFHKKSRKLIKNLKKENFAIFEDGIKKDITFFSTSEAPITVTVVMEYSKLGEIFGYYGDPSSRQTGRNEGRLEVLRPVAMFLAGFIKPPNDYASVIAFDLRPTPITDFTNNPGRLQQTINLLFNNQPAFSDSNLFDALKLSLVGGNADSVVLENSSQEKSTYAGMVSIKGRHRAILLVASGIDTFSKINYGEMRKIEQSAGVPIYIIQTGLQFFHRYGENMDPGRGGVHISGGIYVDRLTFLQAENTMKTFARETGGAYFPLINIHDLPGQLQQINEMLRSQYSLGYDPGDINDGKQHKIVVKVDIDGDGQFDDKEYELTHRQFYNAPKLENTKPAK